MKHTQRIVLQIITIMLLFLVAQATRFENNVTVTYEDGKVSATIDGTKLNLPTESNLPVEENFTRVTAFFQKSMLDENKINRFSIKSGNKVLAEHDSFNLHLFGKDLTGNLIKGDYPKFIKTFGDWTMDRFISGSVVLYNTTLRSPFSMEVTFVGRGYKYLAFNSRQSMILSISDGYLDNNYTFCYKDKCAMESYKESVFNNFKRIINFFIEVFMLSLIIMLLVNIIAKKGKK